MKDQYNANVQLQCVTCGGEQFSFNDDKTYVKCTTCNREYLNGYDELVELNQENINRNLQVLKQEVTVDFKIEINKSLKDAFRGNKYIKFK
jgi:DNA-directed RNA polymerase subunit RPC12/RpoP